MGNLKKDSRLQLLFQAQNKYGVRITFQLGSEDDKKEVFSVAYEHEDKYVAAAIGDGSICIYNLLTNKLAQTIAYTNPITGDIARAM